MIHTNRYVKKLIFPVLGLAMFLLSCEQENIREVVIYDPGVIEATATTTQITAGESITYTDNSKKIHTRKWTFEGGTPSSSEDKEVTVFYDQGGEFTTTLSVSYIDNLKDSKQFDIDVARDPWATVPQAPYSGAPILLPALIQFEDYDLGGEGVSYHDKDIENHGQSQYRFVDGVDIQTSLDEEGGLDIGNLMAGEWLEYTVQVPVTGLYDFHFRLSSETGGNPIKIQVINGEESVDLGETGEVPSTGGIDAYSTITVEDIQLNEGVRTLRFEPSGGGIALNYFEVTTEENIVPEVKYAIYSEDDSVEGNFDNYFETNFQFKIDDVEDTFEGSKAKRFSIDGSGDWAMASIKPGSPVDISEFTNYKLALKSDSNGTILIRLQSGGGQKGIITFDAENEQYGFKRDGKWHMITIPLADFKANNPALDLTKITDFLVFRSEGDVRQANNYTFYLDNFYLSK